MSHWSNKLPSTACSEAVEWSETQPDYETAWATCTRADWMLWLIGKCDDSAPMTDQRRPIVRCALEIAQTVRHLMPPDVVSCIDLIARWCDGADVSREDMRCAAYAAYAYAADAADAAAAAAAAAADAAASAAYDAAAAAAYDAYADDADDAYADDDAAYAAAASLRSSADIVRRHYPTPPVLR